MPLHFGPCLGSLSLQAATTDSQRFTGHMGWTPCVIQLRAPTVADSLLTSLRKPAVEHMPSLLDAIRGATCVAKVPPCCPGSKLSAGRLPCTAACQLPVRVAARCRPCLKRAHARALLLSKAGSRLVRSQSVHLRGCGHTPFPHPPPASCSYASPAQPALVFAAGRWVLFSIIALPAPRLTGRPSVASPLCCELTLPASSLQTSTFASGRTLPRAMVDLGCAARCSTRLPPFSRLGPTAFRPKRPASIRERSFPTRWSGSYKHVLLPRVPSWLSWMPSATSVVQDFHVVAQACAHALAVPQGCRGRPHLWMAKPRLAHCRGCSCCDPRAAALRNHRWQLHKTSFEPRQIAHEKTLCAD